MTRHVMLDIETLGLAPGSVVLSAAAVTFTAAGAGDTLFDGSIEVAGSLRAGLTIEPVTVAWHIDDGSPGLARRASSYDGPRRALEVLFGVLATDDLVWANSPNFDVVLLEAAARLCGLRWPWHHRNLRDLRTALAARPDFQRDSVPFVGTPHDPVDDCRHQIALLVASGFPLAVGP